MHAALRAGLRRRRPLVLGCILVSALSIYARYCGTTGTDARPVKWQPATLPGANRHEEKQQQQQQQQLPASRDSIVENRYSAGHDPAVDDVGRNPPGNKGEVNAQKPFAPLSLAAPAPSRDPKTMVAQLPADLLPQPGKTSRRRLVIVGDVHGMKEPLERLLDKVGFDRESGDHLILVGDMINKGPDSAGVVELVMSLGASAVRGNNEDRVLAAQQALRTRLVPGSGGHDGPTAASDTSLSTSQLDWLSRLPIILRVGTIRDSAFTNLVIVHAGMVPGVEPERQDTWAVMNMRTLVYPRGQARKDRVGEGLEDTEKRGTSLPAAIADRLEEGLTARSREGQEMDDPNNGGEAVPLEGRDGEPWTVAWARHQRERVPRAKDRLTVVYGHDALTGLNVPKKRNLVPGSTFGLDSGCVYGRQLTALVIEGTIEGKIRHGLVQVDCRDGRQAKSEKRGRKGG